MLSNTQKFLVNPTNIVQRSSHLNDFAKFDMYSHDGVLGNVPIEYVDKVIDMHGGISEYVT